MRAFVVLALVLAACGAAAPANTGIRGTVLAGPACPGPARLDSPCPDRPVAMTIEVVSGSDVAATFTICVNAFEMKSANCISTTGRRPTSAAPTTIAASFGYRRPSAGPSSTTPTRTAGTPRPSARGAGTRTGTPRSATARCRPAPGAPAPPFGTG